MSPKERHETHKKNDNQENKAKQQQKNSKFFTTKKQNKNKQIRTSEIILMWEVDEIEEEV